MGMPIEVQNCLALRRHDDPDYSEETSVPAPELRQVGNRFSFRKNGSFRLYDLNKPIPLVVTRGNQHFVCVIGLVLIHSLTYQMAHYLDEELNPVSNIETSGEYELVQVFTFEESQQWLKFLQAKAS